MHRLPRFTLLVLTFTASGIILAQDLSQPYVENEVIVRFVPGSAAADRAAARNSVSPQSVRSLGLVEGLELVRSALDVPQAIATLTNNPNVLYVEPNYIVQPVLLPDDYYFNYYHYVDGDPPGSGLQWGLHNVGQSIQGVLGDPVADIDMPQAWDKIAELTGNADGNPTTRTVVAVIDTGTQWHHEDLADNIWMNPGEVVDGSDSDGNGFVDDIRGWDFFSDDNDPDDESGHGTHTAGTVAAVTDNVVGVAGVCANCEIMAIRFLGPAGGSTADAISSLYYALENGAKVSNNSWGGGGFSQGLYDAIAAAGEAGHIFVAAAGNSAVDNDTSPHYPSAYALDNIISVAATTNLDQRASFSNYGTVSVDLGAPGLDIASTYMNSEYWWNSGTSMAAPHVAGAVALLQALSQDLSPVDPEWNLSMQDIINRVLDSARPAQSMVGITKTGGILNAYNAIAGVYPEPIDPPNVPGTPTGFAVTDGADGTARLSWDSDPDATHYVVEREKKREKGKNKGTWGSSWSYDVSGSTYTDPTDPGEFRYRISAGNASGTSDPTTPWLEVMVTNGGSGGGDDGPKKCHPRRGGC